MLVTIGITPHQIGKWAFVGYFLKPVNIFDVVNRVQSWAESTMNGENSLINYCSNGQEVKHVSELLPNFRRPVFALALRVKSINLSNLSRLMISAKKTNTGWKSDFEQE